jgi:hypothetical protein
MSSSLILLEDRTIQRRGIIEIPATWERTSPLVIVADVLVFPSSYYSNFKFQPSKSNWSNINLIHNSRVIQSWVQEYVFQQFQQDYYSVAQDASFLQCVEKSLNFKISAVGAGLPTPIPIPTTTSFEAGGAVYPQMFGDNILIATTNDTRIRYRLYSMPTYRCVTDPLPLGIPETPAVQEVIQFDNPNKDVLYPVSQPYTPPDDNGFTYVPPTTPSNSGVWSFTFKGADSPTVFSDSAPGFSDDNPGVLIEPNSSCVNNELNSIYSQTRGVRYYPDNLRLSTCGSGAMQILSQEFSPD